MQSPIMPLPNMAASFGAKSRTWYVWGNKTKSGFALSITCFNAAQYPSGVYASSKPCSTRRTSATCFAASSSAKAATPFPITSALTLLNVSFAICWAAAKVSKLALIHFPCRSSVMTRIFMARSLALQISISRQVSLLFLWACRSEIQFSVDDFDGHDDGRVRQLQQTGQQHAGLSEAVIVALQSGQHQIGLFLANRSRQCFGRSQRIELGKIIVHNMDAAVRAFRERFLDRLLHALRAHRKRDHFPAVFFLQPQSFFQRVTVRLVHFEPDVRFLDPVSRDRQWCVFRGNLFDANDNFHKIFPSTETKT